MLLQKRNMLHYWSSYDFFGFEEGRCIDLCPNHGETQQQLVINQLLIRCDTVTVPRIYLCRYGPRFFSFIFCFKNIYILLTYRLCFLRWTHVPSSALWEKKKSKTLRESDERCWTQSSIIFKFESLVCFLPYEKFILLYCGMPKQTVIYLELGAWWETEEVYYPFLKCILSRVYAFHISNIELIQTVQILFCLPIVHLLVF